MFSRQGSLVSRRRRRCQNPPPFIGQHQEHGGGVVDEYSGVLCEWCAHERNLSIHRCMLLQFGLRLGHGASRARRMHQSAG